MSTVRIDTAQNVAIEYEIASVGDRIIAAILDSVIVASVFLIILLSMSIALPAQVTEWVYLVAFVPAAFYHLLCETLMNGQSIGKRIMKIRVVQTDGSEARFGSYFLRWLLRFVEITICYGSIALVTAVVNRKGQRLGDLAAGTCVIKVKQRTRLVDTIYSELESAAEGPVYPQVARLSDEEVGIAREVIAATNSARRSPEINRIAGAAALKLSSRMGVEIQGSPLGFLRTVVQDYNRINGATG